MTRVAVVGAGIAGLTLARELSARAEVVVFEKSRGHGGRMATRRAAPYQFDHGAQFFTAKNPRFIEFLQPFIECGAVRRWDADFVEFDGARISARRSWADGPAHYVGAPGMNALAREMARGLDLRLETRVCRIDDPGGNARLLDGDGRDLGGFDWVVTAMPAAQASELLPPDFGAQQALAQRRMLGCYSLMLGFEAALPLAWQAAFVSGADISWISNDSSKPGRPSGYSLLVHSTNAWADAHFDRERDFVVAQLCAELARVTGIDAGGADHIGLHRWRYANIGKQYEREFYLDRPRRLAAIGDWCIQGRVEAAFLSALALARELEPRL